MFHLAGKSGFLVRQVHSSIIILDITLVIVQRSFLDQM